VGREFDLSFAENPSGHNSLIFGENNEVAYGSSFCVCFDLFDCLWNDTSAIALEAKMEAVFGVPHSEHSSNGR